MHRLVVNPGTPEAWEIQLKPGANLLGRNSASDFNINDVSVSNSHCQILVSEDSIVIRDLGSTNGTYVDQAQIQEANLKNGQTIRLGNVRMVYFSDVLDPVTVNTVQSSPAPVAAPTTTGRTLRLSGITHAAQPEAAAESATATLLEAPPIPAISPVTGPRFCRFHPKSFARYLCPKCNRTFCELCVTTRTVAGTAKKMCRSCAVECATLQTQNTRVAEKGFYAKLPGAFIYPFRGFGSVILICATLAFAALGFLAYGIFGILYKIVFYGFLFLFMQNIIHTTTSDEEEGLGFPNADGLFGAAFQFGGTILVSYGLAIGLLVARFFEVEIPTNAIIAAVVLGCLYFPMAFLAVAMKDTVMAANPLVVAPAILKIPLQYLIACILLMSVFGVRQLGSFVSDIAGSVTFTTRDMSVLLLAMAGQAVWAFVSVYLLTVNMRILGLLYNSNREKLGWY